MTTHNYHEDDECRIVMERFEKKQGNRMRRFIKATVTLFDDDVDEKHDLFYMVKQPDNPTVSNTRTNGVPPLQNRQLLDNKDQPYEMDTFGSFTFRPGIGSNDVLSGNKENKEGALLDGGSRMNGSSSLLNQNPKVPLSPLVCADAVSQQSGAIEKSSSTRTGRLPRTYGELDERYTVPVKRDRKSNYSNVGIGEFPLNKIPDGRFRIYYFRPKNRERLISAGAYKPTSG